MSSVEIESKKIELLHKKREKTSYFVDSRKENDSLYNGTQAMEASG